MSYNERAWLLETQGKRSGSGSPHQIVRLAGHSRSFAQLPSSKEMGGLLYTEEGLRIRFTMSVLRYFCIAIYRSRRSVGAMPC